jgi:hypothetical protein
MSDEQPHFAKEQFAHGSLSECDAIMKGGVTSGIVYPYAILEIATRYRFRSLGGTSAGAIAAAFAAAAEFARNFKGDPAGFVRLERHCLQLPSLLPDLFQADPRFGRVTRAIKHVMRHGVGSFVRVHLLLWILSAVAIAVMAWLIARLFDGNSAVQLLSVGLGLLLGGLGFALLNLLWLVVSPLRSLTENNFGFCSGTTVEGQKKIALTDWLHNALQHIAFGATGRTEPLTFGDLERTDRRRRIVLRMITTNLSMGRPHTLPDIGMTAGFVPDEWSDYFPEPVLAYLQKTCEPWPAKPGALKLPRGDRLPVIVAVRMSLSFPILFKAVPIYVEDVEFSAVVSNLGGKRPQPPVRKVLLSDGGLSSNFPVHLFDSPLPTRPTFAISLDELECAPGDVKRRVLLPQKAITGIGVQVHEITTLGQFGWQVLASAKDWQDQLSSEVTGQRERVARVFLAGGEGGLNLAMPKEVSQRLMGYGRDVGQLFVNHFNFDEHRWRRLLAVHQTATAWLDQGDKVWNGGFAAWYASYQSQVASYKKFTAVERMQIGKDVQAVFQASAARIPIANPSDKFPRRTGQLRIAPRY